MHCFSSCLRRIHLWYLIIFDWKSRTHPSCSLPWLTFCCLGQFLNHSVLQIFRAKHLGRSETFLLPGKLERIFEMWLFEIPSSLAWWLIFWTIFNICILISLEILAIFFQKASLLLRKNSCILTLKIFLFKKNYILIGSNEMAENFYKFIFFGKERESPISSSQNPYNKIWLIIEMTPKEPMFHL